MPRLQPKTSCS